MKSAALKVIMMVISIFTFLTPVFSQTGESDNKLGLPGDNLNLAAVMDIFRQSRTLEDFEAALNSDTARINNLDLNNDEYIDYIKVTGKKEGDVHTILLQVNLDETEVQDVAVIFVEKKGDDVKVQLIGDEELYGKDYILEPSSDARTAGTPNPAYTGDDGTTVINNYYYNTENNYYRSTPEYCPPPSSWIIIDFFYGPVYVGWSSPWYWRHYPAWWRPWRPYYWDVYYSYWYHHHSWHGWWYWRTPHHHFGPYYAGYRINRRHSGVVVNYKTQGVYRKTYANPTPVALPADRGNFPSHAILTDKNPAIIKQNKGDIKPATNPVKDGLNKPVTPPSKGVIVKPATPPEKNKEVRPSTPPKKTGDSKSTPPVKIQQKPKVKPATKPVVKPSGTRKAVPEKKSGETPSQK